MSGCAAADGGQREPAPLGAAGALAYALLGENGGRATHHGVLQVVAVVVVAASLVGAVPHVARGQRRPRLDQVARRVLDRRASPPSASNRSTTRGGLGELGRPRPATTRSCLLAAARR